MSKNSITTFVASFLILGFMFLALPQNGYTQEIDPGCCQYGLGGGELSCTEIGSLFSCPKVVPPTTFDGFFPGKTCNEEAGLCSNFAKDVPTLSEWGLIAMAGVLGIVGFMVIRRKRLTA